MYIEMYILIFCKVWIVKNNLNKDKNQLFWDVIDGIATASQM